MQKDVFTRLQMAGLLVKQLDQLWMLWIMDYTKKQNIPGILLFILNWLNIETVINVKVSAGTFRSPRYE